MVLHQPQLSLHFLGTSGAWPTADRNVSATVLKRGGELLLFDCGEGTQRQFQRSELSYMAISKIFLSHLHGDHCFGLPGLLKTMQLNERTEPLDIYGPRGLNELMQIYGQIANVHDQFAVRWKELREGDTVQAEGYRVACRKMNHGAINLAYAYEEEARAGRFNKPKALELGVKEGPEFARLKKGEAVKSVTGETVRPEDVVGPPLPGRRVVVTGDTGPCEALVEFAKSADVLISEATYCSDMLAKAQEYGHMTAAWAADSARRAGVKDLILTHLSPRYVTTDMHREEARPIFPSTRIAKDFLSVEVPLGD
ncbi:MAG TPA: ribonuclease Z [Candidatus Thermoplasmatota archaeon]|nr:ribonuclease Z [Candidatus Thermoplasmatota archaeon]